MARDYYEILGLSKSASDSEIKSSYRKLAMRYHPDRNPGDKKAEEKFKEISESYEILKDPCLLYTSPSPRDLSTSRMPSSA